MPNLSLESMQALPSKRSADTLADLERLAAAGTETELDLLALVGAESFRQAERRGNFHLVARGSGMHFADDLFELLSHSALFSGLTHAEVRLLGEVMRVYDAPAGQTLITEGDQGDFMLLLMTGCMEVVRTGPHGFPNRIAMAWPGQTLGEMSMIDGMPRFASCVTRETCRVGVIGRRAMLALLQQQPSLGNKVLLKMVSMLSERLRATSSKLVDCIETCQLHQ
ncbi:MAG: cyclic nucleotide-binding domain-containing protein [Lautropia sp.]|nr:cyclic nucleotide-binding domain-containing protein [Lautropia sp.]